MSAFPPSRLLPPPPPLFLHLKPEAQSPQRHVVDITLGRQLHPLPKLLSVMCIVEGVAMVLINHG